MITARTPQSLGVNEAHIIPKKGGIDARSKGVETESWGGYPLYQYNCTTRF